MKTYKIAVAGTGYVGMSIATLLAQHHQVTAVDVILALNGFFLPLLFGYIYLFRKEHLIINEIKKIQKPHKSMVLQYEKEFRRIESEIEKLGN